MKKQISDDHGLNGVDTSMKAEWSKSGDLARKERFPPQDRKLKPCERTEEVKMERDIIKSVSIFSQDAQIYILF